MHSLSQIDIPVDLQLCLLGRHNDHVVPTSLRIEHLGTNVADLLRAGSKTWLMLYFSALLMLCTWMQIHLYPELNRDPSYKHWWDNQWSQRSCKYCKFLYFCSCPVLSCISFVVLYFPVFLFITVLGYIYSFTLEVQHVFSIKRYLHQLASDDCSWV